MRGGYIEPRRRNPNILPIAGWVLFVLVGAAFAWYALLGPGRARPAEAPTPATPTAVVPSPSPTTPPTDTPPPAPTDTLAPTNTPPRLSTSLPTPTSTPAVTLVTGDDGANVRKGPGTFYETVGFLDPGASAVVTGRYEEWLRIDYDGAEGWVANWVVTVSDLDSVPQVEPPSAEETVTVEPTEVESSPTATEATPVTATAPVSPTLTTGADGANVRSGPGTAFDKVGFLEPGDTAVITGRYDRWYQIDYNGSPAWVANWVVTATGAENVPEVEPPAASPTPEVTPTEASST